MQAFFMISTTAVARNHNSKRQSSPRTRKHSRKSVSSSKSRGVCVVQHLNSHRAEDQQLLIQSGKIKTKLQHLNMAQKTMFQRSIKKDPLHYIMTTVTALPEIELQQVIGESDDHERSIRIFSYKHI